MDVVSLSLLAKRNRVVSLIFGISAALVWHSAMQGTKKGRR